MPNQTHTERKRRDHLTLTTEEGKIELTEKELDRVTGGSEVDHKCAVLLFLE